MAKAQWSTENGSYNLWVRGSLLAQRIYILHLDAGQSRYVLMQTCDYLRIWLYNVCTIQKFYIKGKTLRSKVLKCLFILRYCSPIATFGSEGFSLKVLCWFNISLENQVDFVHVLDLSTYTFLESGRAKEMYLIFNSKRN